MKKEASKLTRISANEVNRYLYCPYQWYYKKTYTNKVIAQKYKALGRPASNHQSNFSKGLKYHKDYHRRYRLQMLLNMVMGIVVLAIILGMLIR